MANNLFEKKLDKTDLYDTSFLADNVMEVKVPEEAQGNLSTQSILAEPIVNEEFSIELDEGSDTEYSNFLEGISSEKQDDSYIIPVAVDTLHHYLWEVRQYSLLDREEEKVLSRHYYETGDSDAAAKLITSNLRLVVKIAMEHQRYWMRNLLDLIQEGNVGLLQAVKKFDPFRGIKFSYYASFWIKAYILKFIMDNWRLVRLGTTQSQRKLFYNLRKEKEKLKAQGIIVGPRLLSNRLKVREQDIVDMEQRLDFWELSLDAPICEQSDDVQQNFIPDHKPSAEETLVNSQLRQLFHNQLMFFRQTLDIKECDILDKRLLSETPMTLSSLGKQHGISRERVRQIQERLINKLRVYLRENINDFDDQFIDLADNK